MFKIDSEKELISFLKILAEESVLNSRSFLNEASDNDAQNFKKNLKKEKELYEVEEEESDPELSAGSTEEPKEQEAPEQPPPEKTDDDAEAKASPEESNSELRASLDALERNINALRAGRSLRDSTVESQLEIYFDRLGDDEKSLMVLFIRELSKILSGEVSGNDAADPNDDPYNLDVIQADEEPPAEDPAQPSQDDSAMEDMPADDPEEEEEEDPEEDTSPPIKVGEPQNIAEIRKRIKKLMSV